MKKTLQQIMALVVISTLLFGCGNNDSDPDADISQLVGTWQINSIDSQNCEEDGAIDIVCDDNFCIALEFIFNDNYTWQQNITFTILGEAESESESGTFTVDGNNGITLCLDDGSGECIIGEYSFVGQSLAMTFEMPEDGANCRVTFTGNRQ